MEQFPIARFQVFISSTYQDLKRVRKDAIQALLELKCIPSGMELFPAANAHTWDLIKLEIEQSDYFVLILGHQYGSSAPDGVGYTEKEYRYALEIRKPTIAFVRQLPSEADSSKIAISDDDRSKLSRFRRFVQTRLVKEWTNLIRSDAETHDQPD